MTAIFRRLFSSAAPFSPSLGAIAALCVLSACADAPMPNNTPNIEHVTASHPIAFADDKTQLSSSEFESLSSFMQSVPVGAVGYVGLAADDEDARSLERARRIKAFLVKEGVQPETVHLQPTVSQDESTIVLTVEYAKALPPKHCPDWSKNSWIEHANTDFSNYGCAYYNNITAQMENPDDYNGSTARSPSPDATRDSIPIQKYRTAAPPVMATTSASSPNNSSSTPTGGGSSVSNNGAISQ